MGSGSTKRANSYQNVRSSLGNRSQRTHPTGLVRKTGRFGTGLFRRPRGRKPKQAGSEPSCCSVKFKFRRLHSCITYSHVLRYSLYSQRAIYLFVSCIPSIFVSRQVCQDTGTSQPHIYFLHATRVSVEFSSGVVAKAPAYVLSALLTCFFAVHNMLGKKKNKVQLVRRPVRLSAL
jgi:hypothetical protein